MRPVRMSFTQPAHRRIRAWMPRFAMTLFVVACGGCEIKSFFDPSEVGRFNHDPLVVNVLDVINPSIEKPTLSFANATDVQPEDLRATLDDYVIGRNDAVTISITDLIAPNVETVRQPRVSESGNVTLPLIGQVRSAGLTEAELQQAIENAYREGGFIEDPQVSVAVAEARARTFSILGSVGAPNQYPILKSDFRLLDAFVLARDVTSPFIDYVYVMRPPQPEKPQRQQAPAPGGIDPLAPATQPGATAPVEQPAPAQPFEFGEPANPENTRIIRIPLEPLRNGELKYNIVIRPDDLIFVPSPPIGVYFLGGHIARPGVFTLSGHKTTLTAAVTGASGLDPLAIPERTDIIRRIGPNQQMMVRVNLAKIYAGRQPDIYLQPNDQVRVGTNALAPFLLTLRNAFRVTYGFGFLYDRNFASEENDEDQ